MLRDHGLGLPYRLNDFMTVVAPIIERRSLFVMTTSFAGDRLSRIAFVSKPQVRAAQNRMS